MLARRTKAENLISLDQFLWLNVTSFGSVEIVAKKCNVRALYFQPLLAVKKGADVRPDITIRANEGGRGDNDMISMLLIRGKVLKDLSRRVSRRWRRHHRAPL